VKNPRVVPISSPDPRVRRNRQTRGFRRNVHCVSPDTRCVPIDCRSGREIINACQAGLMMVRTLGIFTRGGNGLGAPFKSFSFRASLGLLPAGSAAASRAVLKGARLRIRLFQRRGAAGRRGGGGWRSGSGCGGRRLWWRRRGGWERLPERRQWEQRHLFQHAERKQQGGWRWR